VGGVFDDEERVEAGQCDGVEVEQVAGQDRVGLGRQELRPGRTGPPWCGVDPGGVEDLPHGGCADLVAEAGELAVHAPVPQVGFSVARRAVSARSPAGMGGRPGRRWLVVQRCATSRWCQRRIVAGVTRKPIRRWRGSRWTSAAIIARSAQDIRGLGVWRRSTASWWRTTTISTSLSAVDRVSRTIQPISRVRIRYVSRSAISPIMPGRGPRRTCRSRKCAEFRTPAGGAAGSRRTGLPGPVRREAG
jgi:hypothetical protein